MTAPSARRREERDPSADDAEEAVVLIQLPPTPEPSREQIQTYASELCCDPYEARLRLSGPLPRLLRKGPPADLEPLAERLTAGGLPVLCLDKRLLLGHGLGFHEALRVREVAIEGDVFVLRGRRHTAEGAIYVEDVDHRVGPGAGALLVRGRYEYHAVDAASVHNKHGTKNERSTSDTKVAFAHLYLPGQTWPFELIETELDYGFLGAEKGMVSRANFTCFLQKLTAGPVAVSSDVLERHSNRVQDSLSLLSSASLDRLTVIGEALSTASDTESGANSVSRMLHHLWSTRGTLSPTLRHAAEALLTGAAPPRERTTAAPSRGSGVLIGSKGGSAPTSRAPSGRAAAEPGGAAPRPTATKPAPTAKQREAASIFAHDQAGRGERPERIVRRLTVAYGLSDAQAKLMLDDALRATAEQNRSRGKLVLAFGATLLVLSLLGVALSEPPPPDVSDAGAAPSIAIRRQGLLRRRPQIAVQVRLGLFKARIALYVLGPAGALLAVVGATQAASGKNALRGMLGTD